MATAVKYKSKSKKAILNGVVNKSVGNYETHPFFVKKANEMKALIKETGLPKKIKRAK